MSTLLKRCLVTENLRDITYEFFLYVFEKKKQSWHINVLEDGTKSLIEKKSGQHLRRAKVAPWECVD